MNSCTEVRRLVFEFLDDELVETRAASVAQHLSLCPPCKGFFAFERTFLAVLHRRVSIDQAPAELRDRIRSALADRKRTDPPS
jgi:mycothiol system anti-sigma-R factor